MVFWWKEGLAKVSEKTKNSIIKKYAAAFMSLMGFRGGCVVGVSPDHKTDIANIWFEVPIAMVYCEELVFSDFLIKWAN